MHPTRQSSLMYYNLVCAHVILGCVILLQFYIILIVYDAAAWQAIKSWQTKIIEVNELGRKKKKMTPLLKHVAKEFANYASMFAPSFISDEYIRTHSRTGCCHVLFAFSSDTT